MLKRDALYTLDTSAQTGRNSRCFTPRIYKPIYNVHAGLRHAAEPWSSFHCASPLYASFFIFVPGERARAQKLPLSASRLVKGAKVESPSQKSHQSGRRLKTMYTRIYKHTHSRSLNFLSLCLALLRFFFARLSWFKSRRSSLLIFLISVNVLRMSPLCSGYPDDPSCARENRRERDIYLHSRFGKLKKFDTRNWTIILENGFYKINVSKIIQR